MGHDLTRDQLETLIVIRFQMRFPVDKRAIQSLLLRGYITEKHGGGWMATSSGREVVKRLS